MGSEDDAESFQSADDEDYFDLPQDLAHSSNDARGQEVLSTHVQGEGGGVLPPGLNESAGAGVERWNLRRDGNREQLEPIWTRLSSDREHVKISKMFSYVLRHAAHKLDVRIRKDGFVRLREIMKLANFKPYNLEELMAVVYFDEKERYTMVREYDGELLIRANQGHTMKVVEDDLLLETLTEASQVEECVHGTYLVHWPFIRRQGLSKVARNHIHLANGLPEDGKIRGMRSTAELFVYVDVPRAMEDGVVFLRSKNDVILTQGFDGWLPVKYFQKAVRIDYNTCQIEELDFDQQQDMPSWPAELAPSGPGEQGTYAVKNLEALISSCRKRLQEINDLKALAEAGQELSEEDQEKLSKQAQAYTELQSLEQRFRQHKGFRREMGQERDQRAKEEAEAGTVVKRKDRAVTPPWERGKSQVESVARSQATEQEQAEWEALGRRREGGERLSGLRDRNRDRDRERNRERDRDRDRDRDFGGRDREGDPDWGRSASDDAWATLGRGRQSASATPANSSVATGPGGSGSSAGRPRFINSKKSAEGPSWRDRLEPSTPGPPSGKGLAKDKDPEKDREGAPSWREAMAEVRQLKLNPDAPAWCDRESSFGQSSPLVHGTQALPGQSSSLAQGMTMEACGHCDFLPTPSSGSWQTPGHPQSHSDGYGSSMAQQVFYGSSGLQGGWFGGQTQAQYLYEACADPAQLTQDSMLAQPAYGHYSYPSAGPSFSPTSNWNPTPSPSGSGGADDATSRQGWGRGLSAKGAKAGAKAAGRGLGTDRGDGEQDWAALGRLRASS